MSYEWDNKKPTTQMLGGWQAFHVGYYALFEEIIRKTGQVYIQIRDKTRKDGKLKQQFTKIYSLQLKVDKNYCPMRLILLD